MELKVIITEEQIDAVEAIVLNAQEWLQKAWDSKANKCVERVIERDTNLQAGKMTDLEKIDKIKELKPVKRINVEEVTNV